MLAHQLAMTISLLVLQLVTEGNFFTCLGVGLAAIAARYMGFAS